MVLGDERALEGLRSPSFRLQASLVAIFVVSICALTIYTGPYTETGGPPNVEFESSATNDTVTITHHGGDSIPRKSLSLRTESYEVIVSDIGAIDDRRIRESFDGPVVSRGDSIVLVKHELPEESILVVWKDEDGRSSILRKINY